MDPEAVAYREELESLQNKDTILQEELYLEKITQLFFFRKKLSTCYSTTSSTDPVFLALKDTVRRYNIPRSVFDDLITGMEDDLYNNRYRTFDELYVYCYRVASVVGLMCIEIYGYEDPSDQKVCRIVGNIHATHKCFARRWRRYSEKSVSIFHLMNWKQMALMSMN